MRMPVLGVIMVVIVLMRAEHLAIGVGRLGRPVLMKMEDAQQEEHHDSHDHTGHDDHPH